jgi:hypothetical protein
MKRQIVVLATPRSERVLARTAIFRTGGTDSGLAFDGNIGFGPFVLFYQFGSNAIN